jgi:hypothetical protein
MALLECVVSSGFHELRSRAYFDLQLQRRRVHPADLGYVPREVGFHGHLLEFRGCPFRESMQSSDPVFVIHTVSPQTYVYSVVYMASHEPEKYQFSTRSYIALFATLITAYYV